jgi:spore coat protein U-like protein
MNRFRLTLAGATLLPSLAPGLLAVAATAESTIAIAATVQAACTQTVTPLAFGTYTGVVLPGTATITATCTNTTPFDIGLDAGGGTAASVSARGMTAAGASLNHVLTSDAARAINWRNTIGTDTIHVVATLTAIYGQVAVAQFVALGAYTNTIAATVTY